MATAFLHYLGLFGCGIFIVLFFAFCIFIHEFGHFLAAIWRGMHVDRFSIGFGKPLFKWRWHDIDFLLSLLPLGGYVALPQFDPTDHPVSAAGKALPPATPLDRILVAFAGPLFNLIFGFMLASFIWMVGVKKPAPVKEVVIGYVAEHVDGAEGALTPEYAAGIRAGDILVKVNGESFSGWHNAFEKIAYSREGKVVLRLLRKGKPITVTYHMVPNPAYDGLGWPFMEPLLPTRVVAVMAGTPAKAAGFKKGDILLEVNGQQVINRKFLIDYIQQSKGGALAFKIKRGGQILTLSGVRAERKMINGKEAYLVGIQIDDLPPPKVLLHPTPWAQFVSVVSRTYSTFRSLFDRKNPIAPRHMSSIVGIVHTEWVIVRTNGIMDGLSFIVMLTFSLAIINLFPLPVLDGGHIVFALIETVIRRRIPTRLSLYLQYAFAIFLFSFILYVTYYDGKRIFRYSFPSSKSQESKSPSSNSPSPATSVATDDTSIIPAGSHGAK